MHRLLGNYYSLLGVDRTANEDEIRKAYRKSVLEFHPDRNPDNPEAEERFKKIQEAYRTISDPGARMDYNLQLDAAEGFESAREPENTAARKNEKRKRNDDRYQRRPVILDSDFKSNEFEGRDLLLGAIVGSTAFLWLRPTFISPSVTADRGWFYAWALAPLLWGPIGYWLGQGFRDFILRIMDNLARPPVIWEALARLLPLEGAVFGVWISVWVSRFIGIHLPVDGLAPATLSAALAASFGSAFGRAFTSVSTHPGAKAFGVGVAAALGAVSATVLSLFLVSLWLKSDGDPFFWDSLSNGALSAILGGALGSAAGSLRRVG